MFPISRRVLLRRNATRDPEHARVARGWRYVVLRGTDAGQQNYGRKRKEGREEDDEGRRRWERAGGRKRGKYNGDGVGVERKDRLYPGNTGCNTRRIPTKDENAEGRNGWPLITA